MDRDKMKEEIAKMLDEIRDEYCLSDHESRLVYSDRILSLLAPVFEKAERWDAYQTDLINEKAHAERFIKLMDAEEGKLRRKAKKYEKAAKGLKAVEDLMNNSEGVMGLHLNGDIAPWSELRTEGRFEEWLVAFDEAISEVPDGN